MIRLTRIVCLTAVWLALWSDVSVANVVTGLLVAAAIVGAFDTWRRGRFVIRPLPLVRLACYFLGALVKSSIAVARATLSPHYRVHTGIIALPLTGCSDSVVTVIANAISLTPGTLTLEVRQDPLTLYVHAFDVRDLEQVRQDLRRFEVLAVHAFGDTDAIAGLAVDDSSVWRER
ncbi:Na+/H+ antiporter subunit E [Desertimonas flava]|jgi:multicomponent Na+:H+ antiporter subunit E|uniref:Na+/H+ antiporter subunit E n=1 Tax=Desertimonas flava TaxID=2064846 RepID=UPI000E341A22|nr:Na+/H+ antiporter subunit E [Desertimonas flava]